MSANGTAYAQFPLAFTVNGVRHRTGSIELTERADGAYRAVSVYLTREDGKAVTLAAMLVVRRDVERAVSAPSVLEMMREAHSCARIEKAESRVESALCEVREAYAELAAMRGLKPGARVSVGKSPSGAADFEGEVTNVNASEGTVSVAWSKGTVYNIPFAAVEVR
jgi:hypothetical protein